MANKVEFGISNFYVGTYTVSGSTVTLGTPYHQAGAVSFSPSMDGSENNFWADNIPYWSEFADGPLSGDVVVAKFDEQFKKNFLGYKTSTAGGTALVKNATKPKVYLMFQVEGDTEPLRCIMYNASLSGITRAYNTITDTKTPDTEQITVTVNGDDGSGIMMDTFAYSTSTASTYYTMFTTPPSPGISS